MRAHRSQAGAELGRIVLGGQRTRSCWTRHGPFDSLGFPPLGGRAKCGRGLLTGSSRACRSDSLPMQVEPASPADLVAIRSCYADGRAVQRETGSRSGPNSPTPQSSPRYSGALIASSTAALSSACSQPSSKMSRSGAISNAARTSICIASRARRRTKVAVSSTQSSPGRSRTAKRAEVKGFAWTPGPATTLLSRFTERVDSVWSALAEFRSTHRCPSTIAASSSRCWSARSRESERANSRRRASASHGLAMPGFALP